LTKPGAGAEKDLYVRAKERGIGGENVFNEFANNRANFKSRFFGQHSAHML
jgi:hypothetical protein